ncbi:hypothetical protein CTA2_7768 [Colletotrichum tanaceti]|nr:hypothetical protein CTA2_7768 [Colletotrichum tanaceti]
MNFSSYVAKIETGTGDWLLRQNQSYLDWSSPEATRPTVLWLYGDAGFGKSVLCAHAIQDARNRAAEKSHKLVVAYQFYSWDSEPETVMTAFLNLAETLVNRCSDMISCDKASEDVLRATGNTQDLDSIQRLIRLLVRKFATLHLFIDGLDELTDAAWKHAETYLKFVLTLAMDSCPGNDGEGGRVKVWITSQERRHIRHTIELYTTEDSALGPRIVHIPFQQKSNQSDIAVLFDKARKNATSSAEAQADLDKLQALVGSNFLWARLMLEDFAKPRIRNQGESLADPTRVPQSFEEYLRRRIRRLLKSNPGSRLDAAHILSCLVYARRPLRIEELGNAV